MKNILYFVLVIMITNACGSSTAPVPATENKVVQTEAVVIPDTLAKVFYRKYSGKIGDLPIVMDVARDQEKLSGSYYYSTIGIPISIEGNINDDGSFNLKEYGNGSVTGIFEGLMPAKGDISGSWYNAKKSKSLPMTLTQVTEGFALVTTDDRSSKNCKFAKEMEAEGIANGCTTLNVEYLTVNCGSPEISTKINSTLISNITDVGGSGQKINTIDQLMKTVNIESAEEGFNGDINFNVVTNGNNTLSISIYNNWYSFGAAHPIYNTVYNNFDLRTGNIIQLEELLKPGFEEPMNRIAEAKFVKEYGIEGWDFEPGNFSLNRNFSIQPGGLLFEFSPYEIGPYSSGAPSVFVSYKSISNWIKADGLLAAWTQ